MDLWQSGGVGVLPTLVAPSGKRKWGCLNVRGCNEVDKKDEIGCMFEECKLDRVRQS